MPIALWPLHKERPAIEIVLAFAQGQEVTRTLLADTGAGSTNAPFELLLEEIDCVLCGGPPTKSAKLQGAYSGSFPIYLIRVQIPQLQFDDELPVVGIPQPPISFDGIAGFRFLNRFTYGNFGDPAQFGLEA